MILERKKFNGDGCEKRSCKLDKLVSHHLFLDISCIEVFANGGSEVFTSRYFLNYEDRQILFSAEGQVSCSITKWQLFNVRVFTEKG
ncbi:GH32 C-terminal domain-containing protein [Peribacillus saganii]|uniref:GH32 C-terminal domain-containing protein n=1 Tax=Peribacillus saganii TaxID=2303992 RepID=UPI001314F484